MEYHISPQPIRRCEEQSKQIETSNIYRWENRKDKRGFSNFASKWLRLHCPMRPHSILSRQFTEMRSPFESESRDVKATILCNCTSASEWERLCTDICIRADDKETFWLTFHHLNSPEMITTCYLQSVYLPTLRNVLSIFLPHFSNEKYTSTSRRS